MKKYNNYKELADAFRTGELDREKYILQMDNDCCHLAYTGDDMNEDEAYDHCRGLFAGNGYGDVVDICNLAGIPCEPV